jgi:hypothetical protein
MVAEALEVLIEVQDADARVLGGGGHREIGEREAMGAVGATGCQLAHRRQDRTLHAATHVVEKVDDRTRGVRDVDAGASE